MKKILALFFGICYHGRMKRFILFGSLLFSLFTPVAFAVTPTPVPVCPEGTEFSALCNLKPEEGSSILSFVFILLLSIAVVIALFFLIWGGIRWITSGGDKAGIEGARNLIIASIVGLVLAFLSFFIVNIVYYFFTGESLTSLNIPRLID